jgi:Xaa-Pro aminopeptidase
MAFDLAAVQAAIRDAGADGWLFHDFRRSNAVAHAVLGISPHAFFSRRWNYYVPAHGQPIKLVSAVESHVLADLPGEMLVYRTWQEYQSFLGRMVDGATTIAMEYVPDDAIPYVSKVDAGTVELVRSLGPQVVSSADFAQRFEAVLTPAQIDSHRMAGRALLAARDKITAWLASELRAGKPLNEYGVQQQFAEYMRAEGLDMPADEKPLVAVNGNAGNPHYSPTPERHAPIQPGDLLLLDFSAKFSQPDDIWADYTWMYYCGDQVPERIASLFAIIRDARDAGIELIRSRFARGERIEGREVDDHVRGLITKAGYGDAFIHRTGHNITWAIHGNGAHLDNLETHDTRPLLPNTITSMEPGIYLPDQDLGLRTEVDVILLPGSIEVTGVPAQQEVVALLA